MDKEKRDATLDALIDVANQMEALKDIAYSVSMYYHQPVRFLLSDDLFTKLFDKYETEVNTDEDGRRYLYMTTKERGAVFTSCRCILPGEAYALGGGLA